MPRRKGMMTGSRTRGRGHKKGRGAGLRGGRGNAGINKHRLLTRLKYMPRHWGMHGFNRHPSLRKVNISINLQELQDMTEEDTVNLGELGYDKLLGKGKMNRAMNIVVAKASAHAISKVESAGGTVTIED